MRLMPICSALLLILIVSTSQAQSDREGTWEMGGTLLDLSSVDLSGANGSALYVDDETGFGFTGAYNFTNRLALGLDITWSDPAYSASIVPDGIAAPEIVNANLDVNVIHVKGIFNLLDNDITPYIEVGAGWTYVDSNIVEGYQGTTCWWDFWWGYVCNSYFDTYTSTRTSHSYALGVRWEIDSDWVFRAGWGVTEIDAARSEDIELDTIQLTFGWRF